VDANVGLFAATIVVAVGMGGLGDRAHADDVTIGVVFAWILGLGAVFLAIFTTRTSGGNGTAAVRVLFGSIFGLTFADAAIAAAQGLPVRLLGLLFLAVLGAVAGEATQAVGALLLLGLLAAPAAAAHRLARSP
jgi:zinc/manganese transport system permease protein